jgi:uncharacterized protein (DUF305 family)
VVDVEFESPMSTHAPRRRGQKVIVLIIALVLLGASVGYFIGVRGSRTDSSAVDIGFMADMSDHHDQAVQMAIMELANGQDPTVKGFARDVLLFQRSELGEMAVLLADHGAARPEYDTGRTVMAWMDMPIDLRSMPGLATTEELEALDAARGIESDRRFLSMMSAHHEGGVHMAQFAAEHAADLRVRELAGRMARYQSVEIREYGMAAERLGPSADPGRDAASTEGLGTMGMDH